METKTIDFNKLRKWIDNVVFNEEDNLDCGSFLTLNDLRKELDRIEQILDCYYLDVGKFNRPNIVVCNVCKYKGGDKLCFKCEIGHLFENDGVKIPGRLIDALDRYIGPRIPTGDFLYNVLTNNLYGACMTADKDNLKIIPTIIKYLYNEAPASCWGSEENVKIWLAREEWALRNISSDSYSHLKFSID